MEKIKGVTKIYDPEAKKVKDIEIEADIEWKWDESIEVFYPWASSRCPRDGEEITFDIIFSDDIDLPYETGPAGDCVHFSEDSLRGHYDLGVLYVKETAKEFAEKMGWKLEWVGNPGNQYYVFIPKD